MPRGFRPQDVSMYMCILYVIRNVRVQSVQCDTPNGSLQTLPLQNVATYYTSTNSFDILAILMLFYRLTKKTHKFSGNYMIS